MRKNNTNPAKEGHLFEHEVRYALQRDWYYLKDQNEVKKNLAPEKDNASKREFDLVMGNMFNLYTYVIECKAHLTHNKNKPVGKGQVVEFYQKVVNYNKRHAMLVMITDTFYTPKARNYAYAHNIHLIDGKGLRGIKRKGRGIKGAVSYSASILISKAHNTLEDRVDKAIDNLI